MKTIQIQVPDDCKLNCEGCHPLECEALESAVSVKVEAELKDCGFTLATSSMGTRRGRTKGGSDYEKM